MTPATTERAALDHRLALVDFELVQGAPLHSAYRLI